MLTGSVSKMEQELRREFADSEFVEVAGGIAVTHAELVGRLAAAFADRAHIAVYALFGIDMPMLVPLDTDNEPDTLGDLIEDRLEAVVGGNPGLIGRGPATG